MGRKAALKMQRLDINDLIEFNDEKFNPIVLVNEPDMRLLLLCLRRTPTPRCSLR
jgi:hypothetical protein